MCVCLSCSISLILSFWSSTARYMFILLPPAHKVNGYIHFYHSLRLKKHS